MVREKEGAKKRREEVLSRRGAIPGDFGEGGSTVNVSGKRLRRRLAQASAEDPDLVGDTGTSSDDNVEDETFPGQFELRRHQEADLTAMRLRMRMTRMRKRMWMPWMKMMTIRVD
jgi:hypothetical protein